ncbi:MAG TPA: hypothetical protein VHJ20_12370 [Polyangia bacterium]|nr:hypothetical protein [Polyangia bacterium]
MSIFAKKPEGDVKSAASGSGPVALPPAAPKSGYGIAETIELLRSLPGEHNGDLVVRIVRATLASLNVRLADIIEDANRKQRATHDRIVQGHAQIAELERQLETRRREVAALDLELKEITAVRERLQHAEKASASVRATPVNGIAAAMSATGAHKMTPPPPPPMPNGAGKSHDDPTVVDDSLNLES